MGGRLSTPKTTTTTTTTNPNDTKNAIPMSSPQTPTETTHQPKALEITESSDPVVQESSDPPLMDKTPENPDGKTTLEEEEGECGFCVFMKGGPCRDSFIAWEECVMEGEKKKEENVVSKCFDVTEALHLCIEAHPEYYDVLSRAKEAEAEAVQEFEDEIVAVAEADEKEKEIAQQSLDSDGEKGNSEQS